MDLQKSPTSPIGRLLRPEEVAELLSISKPLVYRLLRQGQIPAIRINSTVRVRLADLESYILQCRHEGVNSSGTDT